MSSQIIFFRKNAADYSKSWVTATASQGNDYARNVLNRNNVSAWITTGSVDADNTTLTINFSDIQEVTDILLLKHNFKAFTVKYWDGSAYQDFSTPIVETTNTETSNSYQRSSVQTSRIQLTITGTQTPDVDKFLYQFILTTRIGKLESWPQIKAPVLSRNKRVSQMLSGKMNIQENVGGFSTSLNWDSLSIDADLDIIEQLFDSSEGFLYWPCGGDEDQFKTLRQGYRMEDIFLVKCTNDYAPEYNSGVYVNGIKLSMNLAEVID